MTTPKNAETPREEEAERTSYRGGIAWGERWPCRLLISIPIAMFLIFAITIVYHGLGDGGNLRFRTASAAQAAEDASPARQTSFGELDVKPSPIAEAYFVFQTSQGERRLEVHRAADARLRLVFHRPILMFVENPNPIEGYPNIVHDVETIASSSDLDGHTLLTFNVKLSTDQTKALARDAFYDSPIGQRIMIDEWNLTAAQTEPKSALAF